MNTHRTKIRAAVLAAVVAALVLVPSAVSQNGPPYADATGDAATAADISGVSVLGDQGSGQIVFRVSGSNLSSSASMITALFVDSDANPATGNVNWEGADYVLAVNNDTFDFQHWNGSDWVDTPYATVRVCCIGGGSTVMFSVNRSELGNTSEFNFMARSYNQDTKANDDAPDDGMFNYSFAAGGPDIQSVMVSTSPSSGPRAGKQFVLTPIGLKLPPDGAAITILPRPDTYTCKATLRGRPLAGTGTGGCTLRIPKKTRGKKLSVNLTVTYQGATKSVPYTFVVS